MKMLKTTKTAIIGILSLFILSLGLKAEARPVNMVSFQLFYDQLAPYGEWVDDPEYGYIWLPDVGPNFMPYSSNGYWVMTNYGNTWVSNYEWGWAPFHYGRWFHTDYYGWAWVPDYEWGPAWVTWRSGGGYYGWAPLGPRMSIAMNVRIPSFHWVFVPNRYITSPYLHRYYVPHRNYVKIYNRTTIINNVYVYNNKKYVSGPARRDIERVTGSRVSVRSVSNSTQPSRVAVNSRSVSIYRPSIDQNTRAQARPARVTDAQTARTNVAGRGTATRSTAQAPASSSRTESRGVAVRGVESRTTESRGVAVRGVESRTAGSAEKAVQQPRATTGTRVAVRGVENRAAGSAEKAVQQPRATTGTRATTSRSAAQTPASSRTATQAPASSRTAPARQTVNSSSKAQTRSSSTVAKTGKSSEAQSGRSSTAQSGRGRQQ